MVSQTGLAAVALVTATWLAAAAVAQEGGLAFSGLKVEPDAPVEVTSEQLRVQQADGIAIFTGDVRVRQGEMRMTSAELTVEYAEDPETGQTRINRMVATGGVTLVSPAEAAESQDAVYEVEEGTILMTGDVLLTQGPSTIAGDRLNIDLETSTGDMEGNVRSVFQTGGN